MPPSQPEPVRFRELARRSHRDRDVSRAAVAILKASAQVARTLERALAAADLTLPQFNVLMELAAAPDEALPMHELTARLIGTPPNTSWLASRMADAGLVAKAKHPDDARVVVLSLTDAGWSALSQGLPLVSDAEQQLLAEHDRDQLGALAALLAPLAAPAGTRARSRAPRRAEG